MASKMKTIGADIEYHPYALRKLDELKAYENNPRTHSPEQIGQLRASIREFGFTNPLLIDERSNIIAGHGRAQAAQLEGMASVPCITISGLNQQQRRALVIADNQLALKSDWNPELLLKELNALSGDLVNIAGFDDADISRLLSITEHIPLTDARGEWAGMPEFQNDPIAFRSIIMHFKSAEAVDAFAKLIGAELTAQSKSSWFPPQAREVNLDKAYVASDSPGTALA